MQKHTYSDLKKIVIQKKNDYEVLVVHARGKYFFKGVKKFKTVFDYSGQLFFDSKSGNLGTYLLYFSSEIKN